MNILSHKELLDLAGALPGNDEHIDLATPSAVSIACQGKIERRTDILTIWTRLDVEPILDTLRLVLRSQDNGWEIIEQSHNGLKVEPDASLARLALEQNLACALPQTPRAGRRSL